MAEERLQKILARAGITSRRKAEELILNGRVRVEGKIVTELGTKADLRAKIEVDGRRIERDQLCYGILHKPRHMVTTLSDPEGRPTAQDILKQIGVRVVPVGRLDFNTSGALLFTNDGDFAQGLSHAKNGVPKVYVATLQGAVDERKLARWGESIEVEGKRTRPAQVRVLRREEGKSWLEVTINEGKNRQVRRLAEHARTPVVRLARLSHAGISTEGLHPGEWRLLTVDELRELKKLYGVPKKIRGIMEVVPARPVARPRVTSTRGGPSLRGDSSRGGERGDSPRRGRADASRGETSRAGRTDSFREERAESSRGARSETGRPWGRRAAPAGDSLRRDERSLSAPSARGEKRPRVESAVALRRKEKVAASGRSREERSPTPSRGRSERAGGARAAGGAGTTRSTRGSGSSPRPRKRS